MEKKDKLINNLVSDGGLCPIFRTIGCIGDSLSSGEHVSMMNGKWDFTITTSIRGVSIWRAPSALRFITFRRAVCLRSPISSTRNDSAF